MHLSYFYTGYFGRYLPPGMLRIATTGYTKELEVVGFVNPDQSYTLCALNTGLKPLPALVCLGSDVYYFTAKPRKYSYAGHAVGRLMTVGLPERFFGFWDTVRHLLDEAFTGTLLVQHAA